MSFQDLAAELVFMIVEASEDQQPELFTCLQLSSTCRRFKELLAPRAFRTVRFSNDKKISAAALLTARKYGVYIRTLVFLGLDPASQHDSEEERETRNQFLPADALTIFEASTDLFPKLEKFVVHFVHNFDDWPEYWREKGHGLAFFGSSTRLTRVGRAGSCLRELWENAYRVLASNRTVSHLEIKNWPPASIPTLESQTWHSYLGRLETFEITVAGYLGPDPRHDDQVRGSNQTPGYTQAVRQMESFFFHHLTSAKTVKFSGSKRLLFGAFDHAPALLLPWRPGADHMSSLQHLELSRLFISPPLAEFLTTHGSTLKRLILKDALSATFWDTEYPWNQFFDTLSAAKNLALTHFEVTSICPLTRRQARRQIEMDAFPGIEMPPHRNKGYDEHDIFKPSSSSDRNPISSDGQADEQDTLPPEVEEILRSPDGRHRKLFGYAFLDHKTGLPCYRPEMNCVRFALGDDQNAYETFMERVERNKALEPSRGFCGENKEAPTAYLDE